MQIIKIMYQMTPAAALIAVTVKQKLWECPAELKYVPNVVHHYKEDYAICNKGDNLNG